MAPRLAFAPAFAVAIAIGACGGAKATPVVPAAKTHRFDADRALRLVQLQLTYGQRPAGSPQLRKLATLLRQRLPRAHFEAVPGHPGLRNIVGSIPGKGKPIVLGAHYDTESHPLGFIGANDSAAGTAVLIEVARALRRMKRPASAPAIRFVLFDGEEEPAPTDDFYSVALRGSKAYAARHAKEIRSLVLLDYVGNKGLRFPHEANSSVDMWQDIRRAANRIGLERVFPDETKYSITDDHIPFLKRNVPAVDFIDFDYRYADGLQDTIDKLSTRSLDATGETVIEYLRR